MIVNNPYIIKSVLIFNRKTNPILIVDTNAVLPLSISMKCFKMISGRDFQILQTSCITNQDQFSKCDSLNITRELL